LSKPPSKLHELSELTEINHQLIPLKAIADRELASIYGLTGKVYTPHIDEYMQVCLKKAEILACLKKQNILPVSDTELISAELERLYKSVRHHTVVEHEGNQYERRFLPLKLSKSGKNIQKWAKFWLLLREDGSVDNSWESQVREIWPVYFLIRSVDL